MYASACGGREYEVWADSAEEKIRAYRTWLYDFYFDTAMQHVPHGDYKACRLGRLTSLQFFQGVFPSVISSHCNALLWGLSWAGVQSIVQHWCEEPASDRWLLPLLISWQHNLKVDMNYIFMSVQTKNTESCATIGNSYHIAGSLENQYKALSREVHGYFTGPKAFLSKLPVHPLILNLNSLRCFCVHVAEFQINGWLE